MKCIVRGCVNHQHQGRFVGELCGPCHNMLTTGKLGNGDTFIHELVEGKYPKPMSFGESVYDTLWHWGFHLLFLFERRFTTRYDSVRVGGPTFRLWKSRSHT